MLLRSRGYEVEGGSRFVVTYGGNNIKNKNNSIYICL